MSKILIDTNAYSHFLRGDKDVFNMLSSASHVFMSVFVLGELYSGFKGGSQEAINKSYLNTFLKKPSVDVLQTTISTAEIFAEIKSSLKTAGKPIPTNDVWIAAHSLETGSILITYDQHFTSIPGLRVWDELKK